MKVEVRQKALNDFGCHTANGYLVCFCGKCKQEDYDLPEDFELINIDLINNK